GAIVGASGLILTQIMCNAMNRSLRDVITGRTIALNSDKIIEKGYANKEVAIKKSKSFNISESDDEQIKIIKSLISPILKN
ncbi:MAG: NAD(P)(+) transhydrogenase (Re/Si-specific) subunit beta, partial [Defluviitoga tunisiensis]